MATSLNLKLLIVLGPVSTPSMTPVLSALYTRLIGMKTGTAPSALIASPWVLEGTRNFRSFMSATERIGCLRVISTWRSLVQSASSLTRRNSGESSPIAFHSALVASLDVAAIPGSSTTPTRGNNFEVKPGRPKAISATPSTARLYCATGPLPSAPPG